MKKIYLIHGSLGSGKTTLLKEMLSRDFFQKSIVIENEFASFSVDDLLIGENTIKKILKLLQGVAYAVRLEMNF